MYLLFLEATQVSGTTEIPRIELGSHSVDDIHAVLMLERFNAPKFNPSSFPLPFHTSPYLCIFYV